MPDKQAASADPAAGAAEQKPTAVKATETKQTETKPAAKGDTAVADAKPATGEKETPKETAKETPKAPASKPEGKGTKAEEDAVKGILDQLKAERGSSLKDLGLPFERTDLSKYARDAQETPAGTRKPVDRFEVIDQVLLNGTFPVALTFTNGAISHVPSAVTIASAFRKLGPEDRKAIASYFLQERLASFPNTGQNFVQAFENQALAKIHKSEAMHLIFDQAGNAVVEGISLGGGTSSSMQTSSEHASRTASRELHLSMVREEVVLAIKLPRVLIEVPADRQTTYNNVLARFEREVERLPVADRESRLKRLRLDLLDSIQRLGLLVPTVYLLGGRLTSGTTEMSTESTEASVKSVKSRFAAMFSAEVPLVAGGKSKSGVETDSSESNSKSTSAQSHSLTLESTGGDSTLAARPQDWVRSLSNPGSIAVVGWQEPLPVWEFFDAPLRERFAKHLPLAFLTEVFEARVKDGLQRQEWSFTLRAEATRLSNTSFSRKDLDVKQVSRSFGIKSGKIPAAKKLHDAWREVDYALIGSRVREQAIVAEPDHVITYFSMSTNFDPPGIWSITDGGLNHEELVVRMESDTLHGFNWHIEAEQAPGKDIAPSPTLMADIVCLKALQLCD